MRVPAAPRVESSTAEDTAASAPAAVFSQSMSSFWGVGVSSAIRLPVWSRRRDAQPRALCRSTRGPGAARARRAGGPGSGAGHAGPCRGPYVEPLGRDLAAAALAAAVVASGLAGQGGVDLVEVVA